MTPLQQAALDADREAAELRNEAIRAMRLEGQSDLLYDVATDAIEAYERARERARQARKLTDWNSGQYSTTWRP